MAEPYSLTKLINNSWYLSGIVARNAETVSGTQLQDGLDLLNQLISTKSIDVGKIPFFKKYNFTGVIGQEDYFIPGLLLAETLTYFVEPQEASENQLRYPMRYEPRKTYFGSARANNIPSLPALWHLERSLNGSIISVYYQPAKEYQFELYGKFALSQFDKNSLNVDLNLFFEQYYIIYLNYGLAELFCNFYCTKFPEGSKIKLIEYERIVNQLSPFDLSQIRISQFRRPIGPNYAQANFHDGWTPVGF